MKRAAALLCALLFALFAGCAGGRKEGEEQPFPEAGVKITLEMGGRAFSATLSDNETARAFAARLPVTLEMEELNGNEKYCYLDSALPAAAQRVGSIAAGDIMLYGSSCVVLFYESFSTSYSYTRIGRLDDASGLAAAAGDGAVQVTFALENG